MPGAGPSTPSILGDEVGGGVSSGCLRSPLEGYAMGEDTVVGLPRPGGTVEENPLLAVLREGARQMLSLAIEAEVAAFLALHVDCVDPTGWRRRLVRHEHAPKRSIQTGIGPIEVRRPRVRDRGADEEGERIRFTSAVLPAYLRRAKNVEELLPWLYLKGISTGQFEDTLRVLLGPDAPRSGYDDPAPGGRLAGRAPALAAARPHGQALPLRLGRRGLLCASPRARAPVRADPDRRRRRRQDGERAELPAEISAEHPSEQHPTRAPTMLRGMNG